MYKYQKLPTTVVHVQLEYSTCTDLGIITNSPTTEQWRWICSCVTLTDHATDVNSSDMKSELPKLNTELADCIAPRIKLDMKDTEANNIPCINRARNGSPDLVSFSHFTQVNGPIWDFDLAMRLGKFFFCRVFYTAVSIQWLLMVLQRKICSIYLLYWIYQHREEGYYANMRRILRSTSYTKTCQANPTKTWSQNEKVMFWHGSAYIRSIFTAEVTKYSGMKKK